VSWNVLPYGAVSRQPRSSASTNTTFGRRAGSVAAAHPSEGRASSDAVRGRIARLFMACSLQRRIDGSELPVYGSTSPRRAKQKVGLLVTTGLTTLRKLSLLLPRSRSGADEPRKGCPQRGSLRADPKGLPVHIPSRRDFR